MSYTPEHRKYKKLYDKSRWRNGLRLQKLAEEPLCQRCKRKGLTVAAEVVHHIKPHKGDLTLFFCSTDKLESLCEQCHNVETGRVEQHGFTNDIGSDGWPTDNRHPVYADRPYR